MNTEYEAVAQLKFAENRLEKARNLLNAEIEKSEISDENHLNRAVVEESFVASIDAVNKISFALEELESAIHPQEVEYEAIFYLLRELKCEKNQWEIRTSTSRTSGIVPSKGIYALPYN